MPNITFDEIVEARTDKKCREAYLKANEEIKKIVRPFLSSSPNGIQLNEWLNALELIGTVAYDNISQNRAAVEDAPWYKRFREEKRREVSEEILKQLDVVAQAVAWANAQRSQMEE